MTQLRDAWLDLLRRRSAFRATLSLYDEVIDHWSAWSPTRPLGLSGDAASWRAIWARGEPLLSGLALTLHVEDVEDLVGAAMESLARAAPGLGRGLQRLATAWDAGRVGPSALLPAPGRIDSGQAEAASGLSGDVVAFLAVAGLRPALEALLTSAHAHQPEGWSVGICPFCGAPPAAADVVEDGRRRLACHLCGGAWLFARLRCPFCGIEEAHQHVRLTPEEACEEGYLVTACRHCLGYLKEVDRRARWNAGPALVEDWGSPHFDLVAHRQGYRRPIASIVQLAEAS